MDTRRAPSHRRMQVLVIDRDARVRSMVRAAMRRQGHEVLTAEDIASGALHLATEDPDAVVVGDLLADGSWTEVLRLVRARSSDHVPVVLVSGHKRRDAASAALRAGADDFMATPLDAVELVARVQRRVAAARA